MEDADEKLKEEVKKLKQQLEKTEYERDSALNQTESLQSDIRDLTKELTQLHGQRTGWAMQETEVIAETAVEGVESHDFSQGGDEDLPSVAGKESTSPERACGSLKSCSCVPRMMISSTI